MDASNHGAAPQRRHLTVPPEDVALLRISKSRDFPAAAGYRGRFVLAVFPASGPEPQRLTKAITVKNMGSEELPLWKVHEGLPSWLSVAVTKHGRSQTLASIVSTAGLAKGHYHAVVRADNIEPVSGQAMSALYFDVDLEVAAGEGK